MFGAKKRQYRHTVAQMITGMALPDDLERETKKMSEMLKGSIDGYFSKEILPIQAALMMIYQMLQNLHQRRHEPEMTSELDDYKRIFISAAATLDREEIRHILTEEVLEEINQMLDEMRGAKAYAGLDSTYGDIIEENKTKQEVFREIMRRAGI